MADLFRSLEMSYLEAIVPEETAHTFVHQLALLGVAEIVDVRASAVSLPAGAVSCVARSLLCC